jgi:hypothetical protein
VTPRGFGWRIHCGVEVITESSTNKQHSLSPPGVISCRVDAGDGRPYRDGGFGINAGKFSAAGANARARAHTHSVNFAERWRG